MNKKLDTSNWTATCDECGAKGMEYFNLMYKCRKCGYILEV